MKNHLLAAGLLAAALIVSSETKAQMQGASDGTPLEYIHPEGQRRPPLPFSPAVRVGKLVFVSGTPAVDKTGHVAIGDFPAQMKQVMENITGTLKAAGAGWDRVVKVTVMLSRHEDWDEMNRIYATYFPSGNYPARTTIFLPSLPLPNFLLEIDCEAVLQ